MGFRINTNIGAMNAHMYSTQNNMQLDNSLGRLSSGLRINKAADDASGMTIADNLKSQASGLGQAIANANDGVGVVQTADGALNEYISIVDTVRTKAIQAASDGQSAQSRAAIQEDISRLLEEAQNIAATTSFNGQTLLNGAFENKSFHIGAYSGETVNISIEDSQTHSVAKFAIADGSASIAARTAGASTANAVLNVTVDGITVVASTTVGSDQFDTTSRENAQAVVDAFNAEANTAGADVRASVVELSATAPGVYTVRLDAGATMTVNVATEAGTVSGTTAKLDDNLSTVDVRTREGAEKAIIIADYALRDLDKTRSDMGSVQNQLEATVRNISVTQVNVKAAESQIRDVDFAQESANFAKRNILAQSGSYAMSQANAIQQNVMRLLQ